MAEEQQNTQQAEENSETNPSTEADVKNDVPYGRFQEVNGQVCYSGVGNQAVLY